ncbi:hypothetical protein HOU02_gp309 [Caulobacter phage CcrBL9]|uniref:Uncharacterized protein n=1 Tax=Caulobacter phage CcrBL9 TaxID=2283270 RepID=A0A385ECK7_9CAUD|nr:hypothetical protein HOU02_gp309 [Caulobacter phage CcrBL9]AXQ69416.1 hypothetical protein CcrBL9_gp392 [Caulobacter phage CcrBL9]
MRLIINAPEPWVPEAMKILAAQVKRFDEYPKIGWGWSFGHYPNKFFVRRIKDGLSITHVMPKL